MKKGIAQYPMFVYGLIILVPTLILATILFAAGPDFSFKDTNKEYSNLDISLINYLRTPVSIENLKFLMSDLIVYSYHNGDFTLLEEETREIFTLVYENKCQWDISYSAEGDRLASFTNINDINIYEFDASNFNDAVASIPSLDGKTIKVELREIC